MSALFSNGKPHIIAYLSDCPICSGWVLPARFQGVRRTTRTIATIVPRTAGFGKPGAASLELALEEIEERAELVLSEEAVDDGEVERAEKLRGQRFFKLRLHIRVRKA